MPEKSPSSKRDRMARMSSRYNPSLMKWSLSRVVDVELDLNDDDNLMDISKIKEVEWENSDRAIRLQNPNKLYCGKASKEEKLAKRKKMLNILALFSALIGTAGVVVTLVLTAKNSDKNQKNSRSDITLPSNLSSKCSLKAVSTTKGFYLCKTACAQGECCHLPAYDPESCVEEKDVCEVFDFYCAVLSFDHDNDGKVEVREQVEVPPATSELDNLCHWDNIASLEGFRDCSDACVPGKCCYEDIVTCDVTNPEECDGYEACEILNVHRLVTIPPALVDLADLCTTESLAVPARYNECKAACDPGECCLEPIESCKVQNPEMCIDYKACEVLHGTPKSHPTSVESKVVTKCNTAMLATPQGIKECKDICEPATCCFPTIEDVNRPNRAIETSQGACNTAENKGWCSQYSACQTLQHIDSADSQMDAQVAVKEACSNASPNGLDMCSSVCLPAHCCFDETQNCFDNGMVNLRCSDYDACGILYHHDKDPKTSVNPNPVAMNIDQNSMLEVAEHVSEVCAQEKIETTSGREVCLNLCEDNLCCFATGEYNCIKDHREMCIVYSGCGEIAQGENAPDLESPVPLPSNAKPPKDSQIVPDDSMDDSMDEDNSEESAEENPTDMGDKLLEKCEESGLTTNEDLVECLHLCRAHLCCFSMDETKNCYMNHPLECDDYLPCAHLPREYFP